MNESEQIEEGVFAFALDPTGTKSPQKPERPDSPGPSGISLKSDMSMWEPVAFQKGGQYDLPQKQERPDSPGPSGISLKSEKSLTVPLMFKDGEPRLSGCNLSWESCTALASVFTSKNCSLRELDLSNNNLQDSGIILLSDGLKSPHCRLEILRLAGCLLTEKGCAFLASALMSNPSHLRELDLRFNYLEESAVTLLSTGLLEKLETLRLDHCGKCRLKPPPLRYFCELSLDPNTADRNLSLSDDNRRATVVKEEQPYPDHPERFQGWKQLLCGDAVTDRCYWEVQWRGRVHIGVAYRGINRKGDGDECCIGWNDQSWGLFCSAQGYTAWHDNEPTDVETLPPSDSGRVAVFLDWSAGTVSFFCLPSVVSSVQMIHLHTFQASFTGPLYPAFGFGRMRELGTDSRFSPSSVYLSQMEE